MMQINVSYDEQYSEFVLLQKEAEAREVRLFPLQSSTINGTLTNPYSVNCGNFFELVTK